MGLRLRIDMENLLKNWENLRKLFINPIFFTTDFDGTLTPIVDTPGEAKIPTDVKTRLAQLTNHCPVGILSGRSVEDLKRRIGIENIYYSGEHGRVVRGPNINFVSDQARRAEEEIDKICEEVEEKSNHIDGVIVESKGYTASVHYRLVDEDKIPEVIKIFDEVTRPYLERGLIKTNHGKMVLEVTPPGEWDKGKAISLLRNLLNFEEETMTIYLGDDITDEYAFSSLEGIGMGILVSGEIRETAADFYLQDVQEVGEFLDKLLKLLKES